MSQNNLVASGGARPYLDDVRMQQVAVIYELTLYVLSNFAASFHELDGNLLARGTVHSELHLTIAPRVYVLQNPVFRLSAQWVRLGHLSAPVGRSCFARSGVQPHPAEVIALFWA